MTCLCVGAALPSFNEQRKLQTFNIAQNLISGCLPTTFASLTGLAYCSMRDNPFTGTLIPEITTLVGLQHLILFTTRVSGSLPATIGHLTALRNLLLGNLPMSGSLPASFASLTRLGVLDLSTRRGGVGAFGYDSFDGDLRYLNITEEMTNLHLQGMCACTN